MSHCRGGGGRRELQFIESDSEASDEEEVQVPQSDDHVYWSSSDEEVFEEDGEELPLPPVGDERYYIALQEVVYRNSFSMDALLNSTSLTTFIDDLPHSCT